MKPNKKEKGWEKKWEKVLIKMPSPFHKNHVWQYKWIPIKTEAVNGG